MGRFFAHIPPHSIDIKWLLHISSYIYRSSISIVNIDISAPDSQLHLLRLQMLKLCWILASANLEIPTQKVHVSWPVDRPGAALVWLLGGNSFLYFVLFVSNNVFHPEFLKPTILCSQFFVGKEKSREHEHDTVLLYSLYLIDTETAAPALKMISKKIDWQTRNSLGAILNPRNDTQIIMNCLFHFSTWFI